MSTSVWVLRSRRLYKCWPAARLVAIRERHIGSFALVHCETSGIFCTSRVVVRGKMPKSKRRKKPKAPSKIVSVAPARASVRNEQRITTLAGQTLLKVAGLFGGVITLVSNVDAYLKVAGWMQALTTTWRHWTHGVWDWLFGLLGLHLSPFVKNSLTFAVFFVGLLVGTFFRILF